jgi:hypothetical protein
MNKTVENNFDGRGGGYQKGANGRLSPKDFPAWMVINGVHLKR